jgi:Immunity protein Imm5
VAKPKMVKTDLDQQIADLVATTGKRILVIWAYDCAERVLPYFEKKRPEDQRPRRALEVAQKWVRDGVFKMAIIRGASLAAHAAARNVEDDDAARSAARAAGQAVATTHVPTHSIAAAIYAATAVRDSVAATDADAAVTKERQW